MNVKIKKLNDNAIIPTYGTEFSAGADLYACLDEESIIIMPHESTLIDTCLSIAIPEGYAGFIYARSGLATKQDLAPSNKVGVVDSDYRGSVMVSLHNHGEKVRIVKNGERIAQLIIAPYIKADFDITDDLDDTERGTGGFGSTGSK